MVKAGTIKIKGAFLGDTGIVRAYVGERLVFVKGLFPSETLYPREDLYSDPAGYQDPE